MQSLYSREQLIELGFEQVGKDVRVSCDARLFAINGRLGDSVRIDAYAILTGHIVLGNSVHISPFCFLGGTGGVIEMQDHAGLSTHVSVFTKSDDYSDAVVGADKLTGDVFIGERSIVGSGCTIMPGVQIEHDVSVGINCVINQKLDKGSLVVNRGIGLVTLANRLT
ncbi:MAG: hypothetical protein PVG66_03725 [Chromatiales bacterium]|jgi:acetyltransferase-like isoleucine patch superfamily enzyme